MAAGFEFPARRLAISAAGVHVGGGLVLLRALLGVARGRVSDGAFDSRVRDRLPGLFDGIDCEFVVPSLAARAAAARRLALRMPADSVLLCFNSLPPPVRSKAKVVVFVQAPHFARINQDARYAPKTRLRLTYENLWFSLFERNADEFWVQTEGMRRALLARLRFGAPVRVVPFADDELLALDDGAFAAPAAAMPRFKAHKFLYPADDVGHKNHRRLLAAWQELAGAGNAPELILTLTEEQVTALLEPGVTPAALNVRCIGPIPREKVLDLLRDGVALIFPSLAETFGLPLVEAARLGAPIVASERDFVRDVCDPVVTFDPMSSVSIARAVMRARGIPAERANLLSAAQFIDELRR